MPAQPRDGRARQHRRHRPHRPDTTVARVALLTPGFSADEDDDCIPALLDLARELASSDRCEVTVYALRYPHLSPSQAYSVAGVRVMPFGAAQRRGVRRLRMLVSVIARLTRDVREGRLNLLHAFWAHEPGFVASVVADLTGVPCVVSLAGGELASLPEVGSRPGYGGQLSPSNRWMTRRALRRTNQVTAGSSQLCSFAVQRGRVASCELVPLGVDPRRLSLEEPRERRELVANRDTGQERAELGQVDQIDRLEKISGDPCLLHVGSLTPIKGQRLLVEALAVLRGLRPGVRLHIAGEGPERDAIEALAREHGVDDALELHGQVAHDRLGRLYRCADVLLVSSHFEAQSVVAVEAAMHDCAIVGTPVGLLPDLEGVGAASTVASRDPGELAQRLEHLIASGQLDQMGAAAKHWARRWGGVETTAATFLSCYDRLLSRTVECGEEQVAVGSTVTGTFDRAERDRPAPPGPSGPPDPVASGPAGLRNGADLG